MSLIKVIPAGSWDFGMEPTALVKVARAGLRGVDRSLLLDKRAAADTFADILRREPLQPGDVPIHTIAIGATEGYGANRNGDGFNADTCRKQAQTFVGRPLSDYRPEAHNGARFYRNHRNSDPADSYGYVKAAAYNEPMQRIELLVIGNETKAAAARNGGHVLADNVLEDLYNGKLVGGSMACKLAYDVCSICGNQAPSRQQYCTEKTCVGADGTQGFGCRTGLTRLLKSGRQQYVENPGAVFFDWSHVTRPADRTAYGGLADGFQKAAAETPVLGGAWLAEHYGCLDPSLGGLLPQQRCQLKLAHALAECEDQLAQGLAPTDQAIGLAFSPAVQPPLDLAVWGRPGTVKYAAGLVALAEQGILAPPRDYFAGRADLPQILAALPYAFRKLAADPQLPQALRVWTAVPSQAQRVWAQKLATTHSLVPAYVQQRAQQAALRGGNYSQLCIKSASAAPAAALAQDYALYQLTALATMSALSESPLTLRTVALQNTGIA